MRDALFAERIDAFYAQAPGSTVVNATLALLAAGVMWKSASAAMLGTWLGAVAASLALRVAFYRGWRGDARRRENARRWASGATLAMLASGLAWGLGGVAMFQPERPLLEAFWMILLCGIAAGVVAANAFHLPALVAYLVPLLVPIALRAAMEGTGEQWAIASGIALYLVFMLQQGRHQSRLIGDSIAQRLENVELVSRLREEREAADAARERAEAAGEAKARFFAAASHDLRQPLHALSLTAGALAEDANAAARDPARRILRGVDALATLFDHILDSARMESGALRPEARPFALQGVLDAVANDHGEVGARRACGCACGRAAHGSTPTPRSCAARSATWSRTRCATPMRARSSSPRAGGETASRSRCAIPDAASHRSTTPRCSRISSRSTIRAATARGAAASASPP